MAYKSSTYLLLENVIVVFTFFLSVNSIAVVSRSASYIIGHSMETSTELHGAP